MLKLTVCLLLLFNVTGVYNRVTLITAPLLILIMSRMCGMP